MAPRCERCRQLRLHALDKLCLLHAEVGRYALAIIAGLASVSSDPTIESAPALTRAFCLRATRRRPSGSATARCMWLAPS